MRLESGSDSLKVGSGLGFGNGLFSALWLLFVVDKVDKVAGL